MAPTPAPLPALHVPTIEGFDLAVFWARVVASTLGFALGSGVLWLCLALIRRWWTEGDSCQVFRAMCCASWGSAVGALLVTIGHRLAIHDPHFTLLSPYLTGVFTLGLIGAAGVYRCETLRKVLVVPARAMEIVHEQCGHDAMVRVRDACREEGIRVRTPLTPRGDQ